MQINVKIIFLLLRRRKITRNNSYVFSNRQLIRTVKFKIRRASTPFICYTGRTVYKTGAFGMYISIRRLRPPPRSPGLHLVIFGVPCCTLQQYISKKYTVMGKSSFTVLFQIASILGLGLDHNID